MNRAKKIRRVCATMAVCMLGMSLTGCGSSAEVSTESVGDGSTTELSYAMKVSSTWNDRYDSFTDLPLAKELEEKTGKQLNMVHVKDDTAMNLMIASGDLSDIIGFNFKASYQGGEQKAVSDNIVYGMTEDFVKQYAPDYWNAISADPEILKQVKTPEGLIFGFAYIIGSEDAKTGKGLIIRDDWCKELGIDTPTTPDEYYQMLKLFKEKKGAEEPLTCTAGGLKEMLTCGMLTSPFALPTTDYYVDNGKVVCGYAKSEYKEVLAWLNKLYNEGLLDPNFSTIDSATVTSNMLTGKSGASEGAAGSCLSSWLTANKDEDYSLAGITSLVAKKGDIPMYIHYNNSVAGGTTVISTACKDKVAAAEYLNYGYTEEGHNLYNYGIEGTNYTVNSEGVPEYTDLVTNNPDGLTPGQVSAEYIMSYGNGPFVTGKYRLGLTDEVKQALSQWCVSDVKKYKLPPLTIASDDMSEYTSLNSDLNTYIQEMLVKFVKGTESLDDFDDYLATLKKMGMDRVIEIQQKAYDEYESR